MTDRVLLIINPAAGHGRGRKAAAAVTTAARRRWADLEVVTTRGPGAATGLARDAAVAGFSIVLVLGGDGTLHEVANGLLGSDAHDLPAIGAIPVGTGNDFARLSGTGGLAPPRAVDALAHARRLVIDVGRAWNEYFINSLGLGLAGEVAYRVNRMKRLGGVSAYLLGVLQTMGSFRPLGIELATPDGTTVVARCLALEVGNGATSGGGFRLTPDARPDDGLLDYCLIRPLGALGILAKLPRAVRGTHVTLPEVTMGRAAQLSITGDRPLRAHFDGEVRSPGPTTITIDAVPAILPVLVTARGFTARTP